MPGLPNANLFEPPTAEQLARHLASNPPVQSTMWHARLPLMVIIAVGIMLFMTANPALSLLPWLGLMGLIVYLSSRVRATRELQQRVGRAWELAMIRQYREALGRAWDLVPACRTQPELHGRVVTIIAHILGELRQDEAAEIAYSYLLDRLSPDHPLSLRLKVQCAIAALSGDRLADADEALRKLRGRVESSDDPSLASSYRLARLLQDVRTGHYADAADQAEQTANLLRPLGVEAGYGHGLLALCFYQLARHDPNADAQQKALRITQAKSWWDKATLLVPPAALVFRHPDLRPLLEAPPEGSQSIASESSIK